MTRSDLIPSRLLGGIAFALFFLAWNVLLLGGLR